jgi:phage-related protein
MKRTKPLSVKFYRNLAGHEPVREWLRSLGREEKKSIGEDVKTVQYGWPLGMPLVRKLEPDLWEVRISMGARIARILFTVRGDVIILLHGFIKKTQKTPTQDRSMARRRRNTL